VPLIAAAALTIAHAFDFTTFLAMVGRHGLGAELNPFVQRLSETLGLPGLLLGKGALVIYVAAVVTVIAGRRPRLAIVLAVVGTAAGLVGGVSNVATFGAPLAP
jgi:membrane-associated phospholipid phosphatase